MSKRQSIESKIVAYFRTAPLGEAALVYGLVKEEMKGRERPGLAQLPVKRAKKVVRRKAVTEPPTMDDPASVNPIR